MLVEGVDYLPVENGKSFYDVLVVIDWNFTAVKSLRQITREILQVSLLPR
jgi:hypothetical protein